MFSFSLSLFKFFIELKLLSAVIVTLESVVVTSGRLFSTCSNKGIVCSVSFA